jgi:diacylglycerol kinase family enzyme
VTIKHVAIVLNGRAGALLDHATARAELDAALTAAGLQADFIPDDAPLPARIAAAARSGADAVVVAGGDGTVACAAQELAGGVLPLGILPFGTMNLLAKDLRLPIGDLAAGLRVVADGRVRSIDVGEVNGHVFLCASMLGLPVRLGRYREEARGSGLTWLRMAAAALALLVRGAPVKGTLEIGGVAKRLRAMTLTVSVNTMDEASGLAFARTSLDGGELGVYTVRPRGLAGTLGLALRLARGQWRQDRAIRERRAEAVTVGGRTRALKVMNDGEIFLLQLPLHYGIRPGALRVLAP